MKILRLAVVCAGIAAALTAALPASATEGCSSQKKPAPTVGS
ncbi:hypothetical protein SAMN05444336_104291 [Albimonas donghaensis]|uniref:Uncharacterized protein n=1 Tax=Albimonas donghaensis TaxID=356660 RepID=A0A1H3AR43_9RHOB|nr:hypothetical protein [Albimonas donghaensis]SDX32162.1 hypothetical protein SAMN05444336_104291 [Albimonas donghaensis]